MSRADACRRDPRRCGERCELIRANATRLCAPLFEDTLQVLADVVDRGTPRAVGNLDDPLLRLDDLSEQMLAAPERLVDQRHPFSGLPFDVEDVKDLDCEAQYRQFWLAVIQKEVHLQQGRASFARKCCASCDAKVLRLPKAMYLLIFGSQTSISPSRMILLKQEWSVRRSARAKGRHAHSSMFSLRQSWMKGVSEPVAALAPYRCV